MRDLEIRGAGNVLGPEQSGFMLSVGYDMYLKLLEEAVLLEQGQEVPTLDGKTVHIDATWGDQGATAAEEYFAMTPEQSYTLHPWPKENERPDRPETQVKGPLR